LTSAYEAATTAAGDAYWAAWQYKMIRFEYTDRSNRPWTTELIENTVLYSAGKLFRLVGKVRRCGCFRTVPNSERVRWDTNDYEVKSEKFAVIGGGGGGAPLLDIGKAERVAI